MPAPNNAAAGSKLNVSPLLMANVDIKMGTSKVAAIIAIICWNAKMIVLLNLGRSPMS